MSEPSEADVRAEESLWEECPHEQDHTRKRQCRDCTRRAFQQHREAEREACAKIVESYPASRPVNPEQRVYAPRRAKIAAAIRARK